MHQNQEVYSYSMSKKSRIAVIGAGGMVGRAIVRALVADGYTNILEVTRTTVDLTETAEVNMWMGEVRPQFVFLAAAKVGGINANNTQPFDFLFDNLRIQQNVMTAAQRSGVKKLLFLGSSCIYPRDAMQPITESELGTGPLEKTNQWYAHAKITGIMLGQALRIKYGFNVISLMPTNLYGPYDNFNPDFGHVLPSLLYRFYVAREKKHAGVICWGSGTPLREFLHVDDLARACIICMNQYNGEDPINIGSGAEVTIRKLVSIIKDTVGYEGTVTWDPAKPDGTPRKVLDSSRIRLYGWKPHITLKVGIRNTYVWFEENYATARK